MDIFVSINIISCNHIILAANKYYWRILSLSKLSKNSTELPRIFQTHESFYSNFLAARKKPSKESTQWLNETIIFANIAKETSIHDRVVLQLPYKTFQIKKVLGNSNLSICKKSFDCLLLSQMLHSSTPQLIFETTPNFLVIQFSDWFYFSCDNSKAWWNSTMPRRHVIPQPPLRIQNNV